MSTKDIKYTHSRGNVFADKGLENPEEELLKARLARLVNKTIKRRGWTKKRAATVLGITQPNAFNLNRGLLEHFSVERLMNFRALLDHQVTITVSGDDFPTEEISIAVGM
ncbi:MAG: XRE family transcriptional regulator [Trueperaceae bacterium]|nr:MAG: XRE family transcriptional regulator [Trueperaceae bacterium]